LVFGSKVVYWLVTRSFLAMRLRSNSTRFPYTTLFRSRPEGAASYPPPYVCHHLPAGGMRHQDFERVSWTCQPQRYPAADAARDRSESTRLNSSHVSISYAVFCLKKEKKR